MIFFFFFLLSYFNNLQGLLTIIKHPDKMAPMADKLNTMLEKSKDDAQLNSVTAKRHISST